MTDTTAERTGQVPPPSRPEPPAPNVPQPVDDGTRITVCEDGGEHPLHDRDAIATELAERIGAGTGDVAVDSVRPSMGGAWVTVRIFAPITTRPTSPAPSGTCAACNRPFSPTHDVNAPGPTTRHPFTKRPTR